MSPRERNHSPKDYQSILHEETLRYWSPNHANLKSNEYFLAKRQQKIGINEKKFENIIENESLEEICEKSCEKNDAKNARFFSSKNMRNTEKNLMKFKPVLKEKDEKPTNPKENNEKNMKNTKEIPEKDHKILKKSDEYFMKKTDEIRKKDAKTLKSPLYSFFSYKIL